MANSWSFAMPIPLRPDFDAAAIRAAARRSKDGGQARRLLALSAMYEGAKLVLPSNISIVPIPSKSPELNPQENIWQFMRDNRLSNRVSGSCEEIVDYCTYAWKQLVDRPWKIMSTGLRDWAHGF
jgi:transposase